MSLADSVDEGDACAYDFFDDWEAVEVEQRRKAREQRLAHDALCEQYADLEMRSYLAHEVLKVTLEALTTACERVEFLERQLEYEAWLSNREFERLTRCPGG